MQETLGKKIKKARKKAGLTQKELAERAGLSISGGGTIVRYYEGGLCNPSWPVLMKIAEACNVQVSVEFIEKNN